MSLIIGRPIKALDVYFIYYTTPNRYNFTLVTKFPQVEHKV